MHIQYSQYSALSVYVCFFCLAFTTWEDTSSYLLLYWRLLTSTSQAPKKFIKRIQNSQSSRWKWFISPKSCWLAIFRGTQKFNNNVFFTVDVPPAAWETLILFITLFFFFVQVPLLLDIFFSTFFLPYFNYVLIVSVSLLFLPEDGKKCMQIWVSVCMRLLWKAILQ